MKTLQLSRLVSLGAICLAVSSSAFAMDTATAAAAATATRSATTTTAGGSKDSPSVSASDQLAGRFEGFAGSSQNAQSLVNGLHEGSPIMLSGSGQAAGSGALTIIPPTRPMGYGEVSQALSLAEAQLAAQGVATPTPQQVQSTLMGGVLTTGTGAAARTTTTGGILQLRSQGMGWGQIAHALNINAGTQSSAEGGAAMADQAGPALGKADGAMSGVIHGNTTSGFGTRDASGAIGADAVGRAGLGAGGLGIGLGGGGRIGLGIGR